METNNTSSARKNKWIFIVIVVLIAILLIAGGIFIGLHLSGQNAADTNQNADLDPNAVDWTSSLPEAGDSSEAGIAIPGYPSITIPADTTDVNIVLTNPEGNPCYFTFNIVLDDTGESLYQSGMVEPGKAITNITLSRPLPAGTYDATIQISTNSLEDLSAMNGANVATELIVS